MVEVKIAVALVKHDVSFAMANTIIPLMKNIFDNSKIANSYATAKTKTTCIVKGALKNVTSKFLM